MAGAIRPFCIDVSDDVLADLKERLRRTRWPDAELVRDWSQGAPLKWIKDICQYWTDTYNWRSRETQLNRFDQFTSEIDGLDIHFVHVRSKEPSALPVRRCRGLVSRQNRGRQAGASNALARHGPC